MKPLGARGEDIARLFLEKKGLRFREANAYILGGEIDLVMEDTQKHELVFVEVRTRTSQTFGTPEESVTFAKKRVLQRSIEAYVQKIRWRKPYRLDVVGVTFTPAGEPHVAHTEYVSLA